jgi:hypothetical protein
MRKAAVTLRKILKPAPPVYTLTTFAKACKVTRNAARAWITGDSVPTADMMGTIQKLLPSVTMSDWLEDDDAGSTTQHKKRGPAHATQRKKRKHK